MKKFLFLFAIGSSVITAWALYNSGAVFHRFEEVSLRGVLQYRSENCSILNEIGIADGIDRSFCREHFDKIGCNATVRATRTDGEIIGQDCTNRLCFAKLNSEIFDCTSERIVCSDLIEYNDPYGCVCMVPINCNDADCASSEEQLRKFKDSMNRNTRGLTCPNGVASVSISLCSNGSILAIDRGETIGFERIYFDENNKMVGKFLLSDYGEFCGRTTMQQKIGTTFECLNKESTFICGTTE